MICFRYADETGSVIHFADSASSDLRVLLQFVGAPGVLGIVSIDVFCIHLCCAAGCS